MNSFKDLEDEGIRAYQSVARERVRRRLEGTMGTFRFIGQIVDIYLPRMVDTVIAMAGPTEELPAAETPPPPSRFQPPRPRPGAPPGGPIDPHDPDRRDTPTKPR